MKEYTEEMRFNDEYPTVGQKVILNILDEAVDSENERQYNGSELIVVKNETLEPPELPIFYCVEHGFEISINNAHFKAIDSESDNTVLNSSEETELKSLAMVSELERQDDWPKVGDDAITRGGVLVDILAIDGNTAWVRYKDKPHVYNSLFISNLSKPKSKEDLLIEELQTKLIENNAVGSWMLAIDTVRSEIEKLQKENNALKAKIKSALSVNGPEDSDCLYDIMCILNE